MNYSNYLVKLILMLAHDSGDVDDAAKIETFTLLKNLKGVKAS